ncbi:MAG TPA: hypothetical protein VF220_05410 [Nitrososphaeraceae archaeon]
MDLNLVTDGILKATNHRSLYPLGSGYHVWTCSPAKGVVYLTEENKYFVSGHCRMRARPNGAYPYFYTEMIDSLFGTDDNTIEVCSYMLRKEGVFTVDVNPEYGPDLVADAQDLAELKPNSYTRWRADPPYNAATAKSMYNCEVPNFNLLLKEGLRLTKPGSLLFLLLGSTNYQIHPKGIKRIGLIFITLVPNNEIRCLNIYIKDKE